MRGANFFARNRAETDVRFQAWSTPRVAEHHAKHIRRQVDKCPHRGA